jgi:hypothetical protein
MSIINVNTLDSQLQVTLALPAAGAAASTSGNLDLQGVGPFSASGRLGVLIVDMPAVPGNTAGNGISIALQVADASLTGSSAAPALPTAGTFAAPNPALTLTIAAVAVTGSAAGRYYFPLPFDAYASAYQFYNFVVTAAAQSGTAAEVVTFSWGNLE